MRVSAWALVFGLGASSLLAVGGGCGSSNSATFSGNGTDGGGSSSSSGQNTSGTIGGNGGGDEGGVAPSAPIAIEPADATVDVEIVDGELKPVTPVTFKIVDRDTRAPLDGASWSIDRGEVGTIVVGTGVFTANGNVAGVATVTASYGTNQATSKITINVRATNGGANAKSGIGPQTGPVPKGGFNGVGGEVLGAAPSDDIKTKLATDNPVDVSKFEMLAPYDKTVFPRAILPPLVQWRTESGFDVKGYSIHLKQTGFDFRGTYAPAAGSTKFQNAPIDAEIWKRLLNSNQGDPVTVEIKVTDGTTTYGPIVRTWTIAPGILRGTVYYNSYGTLLADKTQGEKAAAVLRISPGQSEPQLAIPGAEKKCAVCHEVSANGNRLFSNDTDQGDYGYARSYDLTADASVIKSYGPSWGAGFDSAKFIGKLSYSAPYPDGTFFLASSGENYHHWPEPSDLFSADTYEPIATTGFKDVVKRAVTPAFSPDGSRVAFTYWESAKADPLADGGHTLVVMDFDCNRGADGNCGAPPYKFSNLRKVAHDDSAYLGWPAFSPDGKWLIYQRSTNGGDGSVLNTSKTGRADLWIASADLAPTFETMKLCSVNGFEGSCVSNAAAPSFLPTGPNHPQKLVDDASPGDTNLAFEPTITPIVSGGYAWLIFTTRRLYGNVATLEPYAGKDDGQPMPASPVPKKLWVAAIELAPKTGTDPSHPPFYLPGQELLAGNMRAFWENDPCRKNGSECETGNECCNGFCRDNGAGKLVCGDKPAGCVQEFETCKSSAECCGTALSCIGGKCAVAGGVH